MTLPARTVPLPTPKQALDDLIMLREGASPKPGVAGKVSQGLDIINKGLEITERIRVAQAQQATIDTAEEFRCFNQKLSEVLFNRRAELEFYQNLLRVGAQIAAAIRMHAHVTNNAFALDPFDLSTQDNPDGPGILTFEESASDLWDNGIGRETVVRCTKEIGG